MKYEKPVIGRFQLKENREVVVDVTCLENENGYGEGYVVKHSHDDKGSFYTNWIEFTNPDWIQIPIEEEENMNNVQQRIEALQQSINNSQKELEGLQNALEEQNKKKIKKKKIDWSKIPIDTSVIAGVSMASRRGHFAGVDTGFKMIFDCGQTSFSYEHRQVQCNDMTIDFNSCKWQPWFGGGRPIPEGILVDVIYRSGERREGIVLRNTLCWGHDSSSLDIIAYRIAGVEEGWEL